MQIKKQTDQAIRILVHLANERQKMVGKEIANLVGVSEKYLPYIMQQLRQAGLVSSSSGTTGGYVLAKQAKTITLLEVMTAIGDFPQISCYAEDDAARQRFGQPDALLKNYNCLQQITSCYFSSVTIWDLTERGRMDGFYSKMDCFSQALNTQMQINGGGRA